MFRLMSFSVLLAILILVGIPATGLGQEIKARGRVHALRSFELRMPPGEVLATTHVGVGDAVEVGDTLAVKEAVDLEIRLNDIRGRVLELRREIPTIAETTLNDTRRDQDYDRQRGALRALLDSSGDPEETRRIENEIRRLDLAEEAEIQREQRDGKLLRQQLDLLATAEALIVKKIGMCAILSPIGGTVTAMTCQPGSQRGEGGAIAIRSMAGLQVRCEVPQNAVGAIDKGLPAVITPDFMDGVQFIGQVVETGLEGRINAEGFVFFPVVVSIDGETGPLIPGMTVSVIFRGDSP